MAAGAAGAAGGLLAVEVCVPLLMLCWFCCWPDDRSETSSNGKAPRRPVMAQESPRRRSLGLFGRRAASSAVSLHLPVPSTSGVDSPLQFRSHEELRRGGSRGGSRVQIVRGEDGRYHSAPSVIDQVLHRRDWERSSADLRRVSCERQVHDGDIMMIPLRDPSVPSPPTTPRCKKHHTNIKSSKHKEESRNQEFKDIDQTVDISNTPNGGSVSDSLNSRPIDGVSKKTSYKAKEAKQSLNESIKSKKQLVRVCEGEVKCFEVGREGAVHGEGKDLNAQFSPLSVEAAGYELSECYLSEPPVHAADTTNSLTAGRGRHASDGDILAPAGRPESGAFSENDLELNAEIAKAIEDKSAKVTTSRSPRTPRTSKAPKETAI